MLALRLFSNEHLILPVATTMLIAWPLALFGATFARYRHSRIRQRALATALAHYLPAEAAKTMSVNVANLARHQKRVNGICLLTDLRGFTRWSEGEDPSVVHQTLNTYYERLIAAVREEEGLVANLVGDGMLAIWTAPAVDAALVQRAIRTALAVTADNDPVLPQLPTCAALHGGPFSLGNLGALDHFEYSPVGDIVNATAHIESLNRLLGTRILVSEALVQHLTDFILRPVGGFTMKRKTHKIRLYEVLGKAPKDELTCLAEDFAAALTLYETDDRQAEARAAFAALLQCYPQDGPSRYYYDQLNNE